MDVDQIRAAVINVLHSVQSQSGRDWVPITDGSKPIGALDGFDSLSGLEATVLLEEITGISFGRENIFVSEKGDAALNVGEIVTSVIQIAARKN